MKEKIVGTLRRTPERTWFLLSLFVSTLLGSFFQRGRMALQLYLVIPWAIGLVYSRLRGRRMAKTAANGFLLAAALVFTATCVYREDFDMPRWLALIGMGVYALAVSQPDGGPDRLRHEMRAVAVLLLVCVTPMMLMGLTSVFVGRPFQFLNETRPVGIVAPGEITSRIQVLSNTNSAGRSSVLVSILAVYLFCISRRRWVKGLTVACIVVLTMTLAHTQSRTSVIAYGAAAGAMVFRGLWLKLEGRRGRALAAAAGAAIAIAAAVLGVSLLYSLDIRIASALQSQRGAADASSRALDDGVLDVLGTGRGELWGSTLNYLKAYPRTLLVGLGTGNIVQQVLDPSSVQFNAPNLHNSFLECLLCGGLPLLICALGYLCALVKPALRALLARETDERRGEWVLPVLTMALVLISLTENTIFTSGVWANGLFFLTAGWLLNMRTGQDIIS